MARNRYYEDEQLVYKFSGKSLMKALKFAKPHRKTIVVMIIVMVVMCFVALLPPMINRYIVDYVLTKTGLGGLDFVTFAVILIAAWIIVSFTDVLYTFVRTYFMSKTGHGIVHDLRDATFVHLQKLSFDYYDNRPAGKILVRVTNYLNELADVFTHAVVVTVVETLKVALILVWLFVLDWRLALVVLGSVVPMGVCIFFLRKALSKRHRAVRNKVSNRTAFVAENIQGAFVTKAFNRSALNGEIYDDLNEDSNRAWLKVIRLNELFFPTLDGFFYLGLLCVYGVVIYMAASGMGLSGLTLGKLLSFITYMGMFSQPLNNIAGVVQMLTAASTNLERVFEVGETSPSVYDEPNAVDLPPIEGRVTFENVTFCYENNRPVLQNFNLDVPAGKMIALVGPTGAGKTTVVNLISRFYNVQQGRVLVDGQDVQKVTLHSLRSQVGVMMQDSFVFSGTIMDNIRYARPDADEAQCVEAAKKALAHDFIMRLEKGYQTSTREQGAGLSTGERQLLSLARVMLCDPKILILDEATSSIDTATEELIKEALDKALKGRTSFVIAHRLSTIKKADCILYIDDKSIAEAGTHEQLMRLKGKYYNLVTGVKEAQSQDKTEEKIS